MAPAPEKVWHRERSHAAQFEVAREDPVAMAAWQAADAACAFARRALALPPDFTVRWLAPVPAGEGPADVWWERLAADPTQRMGRKWRKAAPSSGLIVDATCAAGRFVFVFTGQTPRETALATLHELRHFSQLRRWGAPSPGTREHELFEVDAEAWATLAIEHLEAGVLTAAPSPPSGATDSSGGQPQLASSPGG